VALKLALDTNRYTDLCRGDDGLVAILECADAVFLPFIVLAELRAGFAVGRHVTENEAILDVFLNQPGVEVLYASAATCQFYADLYRQLRRQGTPIPSNDLWIAALVIEHQLPLCSRDRHFTNLPQIKIV